jgi:hypothetical protein
MEIFIYTLSMFNNVLMIIKLDRNMSQLRHVSIYFYHLQGITEINLDKTYIKILMRNFIYALSMFNNTLVIIMLDRNMSQLRQILCEKYIIITLVNLLILLCELFVYART